MRKFFKTILEWYTSPANYLAVLWYSVYLWIYYRNDKDRDFEDIFIFSKLQVDFVISENESFMNWILALASTSIYYLIYLLIF